MKQKKKLHYFYLVLGFVFILVSCSKKVDIVEVEEPKVDDFILCEDEGFKNDSTLDCGCDSEEIFTVKDYDNVGFLSKLDTTANDDLPKDFPYSYVIAVEDEGGGGTTVLYICNDFCISPHFDNAFLSSDKIKVSFSGHSKRICVGLSQTLNFADFAFVLTKITKI